MPSYSRAGSVSPHIMSSNGTDNKHILKRACKTVLDNMIIVEALKTNKNPPNKGKKESSASLRDPANVSSHSLLSSHPNLPPVLPHSGRYYLTLSALRDRNTDN